MSETIYIHGFTRTADAEGELAPGFPTRATASRGPALAPLPEAQVRKTLIESGLPPLQIDDSLAAFAAMTAPLISLALAASAPERVGLVVGTSTAGLSAMLERLRAEHADGHLPADAWQPMALGRMAEALAFAYGIGGPAYVLSTACTAGAKAIAEGARLLRCGRIDVVIAGGMDFTNDLTTSGFAALGAAASCAARPFAKNRSGLRLGAGGGFVLMSRRPILGSGAAAELILAGWGETSDAHHISAPEPEGKEARRAIEKAIRRAGFAPGSIDFAVLHGTATQQNDPMEAKAVHAVLGPDVPCASLKGVVGHQLAGAGAYGAAAALEMLARTNEEGAAPLPINFREGDEFDPAIAADAPIALTSRPEKKAVRRVLVNAFAFGGSNAALVFASTKQPPSEPNFGESSASSVPAMPKLPADASLFLAQRPPMQMIDEAVELFAEGAASKTVIRADNLLCRQTGSFPSLGLIEVMAQTIGIFAGSRQLREGARPSAGLLLGTRKMLFDVSALPAGAELYCRVEKAFESDEGLWQFNCSVSWVNAPVHPGESRGDHGRPIGSATLTVFNPPAGYFDDHRSAQSGADGARP